MSIYGLCMIVNCDEMFMHGIIGMVIMPIKRIPAKHDFLALP